MTTLILGTAQWGSPYGITNSHGRLSDGDVAAIAAVARARGVTGIDTARGYGDSEVRLHPFSSEFSIPTKITGDAAAKLQIERSLEDLGIGRFDAVLVHDWEMLSEESCESVVRGLGEAHSAGLVDRVGVSIYSEAGVESAHEIFSALGVELGALQVPANPLDRRLDDSLLLMELRAAGAQVVVRSAFLQGVLLAESGRWADHVDVRRFRAQVAEQGGTAVSACLGHVRALPWATHVVVGVTSAAELSEICDAWDESEPEFLPASLASTDLELIDPRQW